MTWTDERVAARLGTKNPRRVLPQVRNHAKYWRSELRAAATLTAVSVLASAAIVAAARLLEFRWLVFLIMVPGFFVFACGVRTVVSWGMARDIEEEADAIERHMARSQAARGDGVRTDSPS